MSELKDANPCEVLERLCKNSITWNDVAKKAAEVDNKEVLKIALQNTITKKDDALFTAAHYGHLECVKELIRNGAQGIDDAMNTALSQGHAECAEYLRDQGGKVIDITLSLFFKPPCATLAQRWYEEDHQSFSFISWVMSFWRTQ